MGAVSQTLHEGERAERPSSARLRILTARMALAILVSPWFIVGYVWGFTEVLSRSIGMIGGRGLSGWELIVVFSLMAVGPTAISLSLSPSWRGGLAAFIASSALIIGFLPVGGILGMLIGPVIERYLSSLVPTLIGPLVVVAILGAIPILIALPLTGYVHGGQGYTGLFIGIFVGGFLTLMYSAPGPWHMIGSSGTDLLRPSILLNSGAPFAFVWTSAIFCPELFRRRVGWAGFVIWAVLQGAIFGLAPLLNLLATV